MCHPSYPDHDNLLFTLPLLDPVHALSYNQEPRFDCPPTAFGIHFGTLITACMVVACNTPGRLCLDRNGLRPIEAAWNQVLTGVTVCYYHAETATPQVPYPTCPSFWHWEFPHDKIPDQWLRAGEEAEGNAQPPRPLQVATATRMSTAVQLRDASCRLTLMPDGTENNHIIPISELEWFKINGMMTYNRNQQISGVHDMANGILVRADLHRLWDLKYFTYVPKGDEQAGGLHWVVHCFQFSESTPGTYHNRPLHRLSNVAPEFLYARFAYTIFSIVQAQVQAGVSARLYRIRITERHGQDLVVKGFETRSLNALNSADMNAAARPLSSPRKRKAVAEEPGELDGTDLHALKRHHSSSPGENDDEDDSSEWCSDPATSWLSVEAELVEEDDANHEPKLCTDMRTTEAVERQAAFLIETEHPAELFGTLIPPVGECLDYRLLSAVSSQLREQNDQRDQQCWDAES